MGFEDFVGEEMFAHTAGACQGLDRPAFEYTFGDGRIGLWQGESVDQPIEISHDHTDGHAAPGALRGERTLRRDDTGPGEARVRLELGSSEQIGCISAQLKIYGQLGLDARLRERPAAWIVYAMSGDGWCWAQADTAMGYRADLNRADTGFRVGVNTATPKLSTNGCVFDASQIIAVGVGIASYFDEPWDATFFVDDVQLFREAPASKERVP